MVGFVAMPKRRWSKRHVVSNGYVALRPCCRFGAAGAAKSSTSALACVIPTMRMGMGGGGKVVRNAEIPGPRAIINSTPRTPSISPDIELWPEGHETQITSTKRAREEAFLDTLAVLLLQKLPEYIHHRNTLLNRLPLHRPNASYSTTQKFSLLTAFSLYIHVLSDYLTTHLL